MISLNNTNYIHTDLVIKLYDRGLFKQTGLGRYADIMDILVDHCRMSVKDTAEWLKYFGEKP